MWSGCRRSFSLLVAVPIFIVLGLYRAIFRYAGMSAFMTVVKAVAIYALAFMTIFTAISVPGVRRTVGILQPLAADRHWPVAHVDALLAW